MKKTNGQVAEEKGMNEASVGAVNKEDAQELCCKPHIPSSRLIMSPSLYMIRQFGELEKVRERYEYRKYQACSHPVIVSRIRKE